MLLNYELTTDLKINTLINLNKQKQFEETSNLKVNRSQLVRELNIDKRTVSKYIEDFEKRKHSIKSPAPLRFETLPGQQAQLDWKGSNFF